MRQKTSILFVVLAACFTVPVAAGDLREYFHHTGPLKHTLRSNRPLPVYDANPAHLWNRVFSAFYIRPRYLPAAEEQPATVRYEGGDVIEFLAWGRTTYWSSQNVFDQVNPLLDEFLEKDGAEQISDPLKRAILQHDLWAVHDHLMDQNIRRTGDSRRNWLRCHRLTQRRSSPASLRLTTTSSRK